MAWYQPVLLNKTDVDTWSIVLKFNGSIDGYGCSDCANNNLIPVNGKFEYRIMTSKGRDMRGANCATPVHISKIEKNFPTRQHTCNPFFFSQTGEFSSHFATASQENELGIERFGVELYLPPSFKENPYKTYKTYLLVDEKFTGVQELLEEISMWTSVAEETIVIVAHELITKPEFDSKNTDEDMDSLKYWRRKRIDFLTAVEGTVKSPVRCAGMVFLYYLVFRNQNDC